MIKPPALVRLDFEAGMARRYVRRHSMAVAGLGWQLWETHQATFDVKVELPAETVERFRATGAA